MKSTEQVGETIIVGGGQAGAGTMSHWPPGPGRSTSSSAGAGESSSSGGAASAGTRSASLHAQLDHLAPDYRLPAAPSLMPSWVGTRSSRSWTGTSRRSKPPGADGRDRHQPHAARGRKRGCRLETTDGAPTGGAERAWWRPPSWTPAVPTWAAPEPRDHAGSTRERLYRNPAQLPPRGRAGESDPEARPASRSRRVLQEAGRRSTAHWVATRRGSTAVSWGQDSACWTAQPRPVGRKLEDNPQAKCAPRSPPQVREGPRDLTAIAARWLTMAPRCGRIHVGGRAATGDRPRGSPKRCGRTCRHAHRRRTLSP